MFGSSPEWIPVLTGPVGKCLWLSNAFALSALCYIFLPQNGVDPKLVFQSFFIIQLPWIPLLAYMLSTGVMGIAGIAQFGSFSITVTALSVYTYLKL
jgi:hypothetical protein